jgi:hypothetical protein
MPKPTQIIIQLNFSFMGPFCLERTLTSLLLKFSPLVWLMMKLWAMF